LSGFRFQVYGLELGAWSIGLKARIKVFRVEATEFRKRNYDEIKMESETRDF